MNTATYTMCCAMAIGCLSCSGGGERDAGRLNTWVVDTTPSVVIGVDENRPGHDLFRVFGATRMPDGRVAIANGGTAEIRIFDHAGDLIRATAGEGQGPGELRNMWGMIRLPGDTLLVLSMFPGYTWYSPEGDYVRQSNIDYIATRIPCMLAEGGIYPLTSRRLLLRYEANLGIRGCPPAPDRAYREDGMVATFDIETEALDTLTQLPGTERNGPNYRAYGRMLITAADTRHIFVAETGGDSIFAFHIDGQRLTAFPMPFEAGVIPRAAKEEDIRRFQRRDGTEALGQPYEYHSHYPRIGRLLADSEGLLWAMAYPPHTEPVLSSWVFFNASYFQVADDGAQWRVLDTDGRLHASVRTPPGVYPLEIGEDYVLGLSRDDLDVQSVALYALDRAPGT